jgi:lysozyme family protein
MPREEAADIYRAQYWGAIKGDDLPAGVDLAVFDYAVNSGPARAIKALQKAVHVPADGSLGMITINAAKMADPSDVAKAICAERSAFLHSLRTFPTFGKGWMRRVNAISSLADHMADSVDPVPSTVLSSDPAPGKARDEDQKVSSSVTGKAGISASAGVAGEIMTSTVDKLSPFGDTSTIIHAACALLIVVGAGLTIYAAVKGARAPQEA